MSSIPKSFYDLFKRDLLAHFVTMMPDGTPYTRPVWIDYDADANHIIVNSERDRPKAQNADRNAKVALSITDPDQAYRFISIQGEVEELRTRGTAEHLDQLARRYLTVDEWPSHAEDRPRVQIRIHPNRVITPDTV